MIEYTNTRTVIKDFRSERKKIENKIHVPTYTSKQCVLLKTASPNDMSNKGVGP